MLFLKRAAGRKPQARGDLLEIKNQGGHMCRLDHALGIVVEILL
jgi:hypothetical protein